MLIDTHCHIQDDFPLPLADVLRHAHQNDVQKMIAVGTDIASSQKALELAQNHNDIYAIIGVHPHESKEGFSEIGSMAKRTLLTPGDVAKGATANGASVNDVAGATLVGIGEIGLDYFYDNSPRDVQQKALTEQIEVALRYDLPISFHVREAFDDFWPIFDSFHGIRGVLHSFTDSRDNLEKGLARNLFIGLNGISTFTKDVAQQHLFDAIPLERIIFETDAPFLTPKPYRGKVNEPAYVRNIADYHALRRNISLMRIADATTHNATTLFNL